MGRKVSALEKCGVKTEIGDFNRNIQRYNTAIDELEFLNQEISELKKETYLQNKEHKNESREHFKAMELPFYPQKVVVWGGNKKPNFQEVEGAEILQWRVRASDDSQALGMAYARAMTAKEICQNHATLQAQMKEVQEKMKALYNLPKDCEQFQQNMQKEIHQHLDIVNKALEEIFQQLNKAMQGEMKPHEETLNYIIHALKGYEERLTALERRSS